MQPRLCANVEIPLGIPNVAVMYQSRESFAARSYRSLRVFTPFQLAAHVHVINYGTVFKLDYLKYWLRWTWYPRQPEHRGWLALVQGPPI